MNVDTFIKTHPDSRLAQIMIRGTIDYELSSPSATIVSYDPSYGTSQKMKKMTKLYSSAVSRLKLLNCDTLVHMEDLPTCSLCRSSSIKIKLNCEHVFCFHCVKNYSIRMQTLKCPDCNTRISYYQQIV